MTLIVHDILGKLTTIRAAVWDAQNHHQDDPSLQIATDNLVEVVKLVETLRDTVK